jgi:toxin secretion/phage lysis holin
MKSTAVWSAAQCAAAAIGAFLGFYIGEPSGALYALIAFVCADYVTGCMAAFVRKELSSEVGARGIVKKATIFIIIGVGNLADAHLLGGGQALRTALIFFYAANELVSLAENSSVIGLPVPKFLTDALAQIRKKSGEADEKTKGKGDNNE